MKRFILSALCLIWISGFAQTVTILIDPGHGGSDPGHESASKKHKQEKDLTLLISKKLGSYLTEKLSHVKVIYTRTDDTYPTLDQRVEQANNNAVDYFISVHCNGSDNTAIYGTESHVHSLAATKSVRLAKEFENQFSSRAGRKSRGVKDSDDREHSIQVLKYTKMTSVLVECGFLTNTKEASFLNSDYGQDIIASALFRAMRNFLKTEHKSINFTKSGSDKKSSDKKPAASSDSRYTVQLMSSKTEVSTADGAFKKLSKEVAREKTGNTGYKYRYVSGEFSSKADASNYLREVRNKGFPDAMIVRKE